VERWNGDDGNEKEVINKRRYGSTLKRMRETSEHIKGKVGDWFEFSMRIWWFFGIMLAYLC
jgi:hypothetical protein